MRKMIYIGFLIALGFIVAISYPRITDSIEQNPVEVWVELKDSTTTTFSLIKEGSVHWDENL